MFERIKTYISKKLWKRKNVKTYKPNYDKVLLLEEYGIIHYELPRRSGRYTEERLKKGL